MNDNKLVEALQQLAERVRHLETLEINNPWVNTLQYMLLPQLRAFWPMNSIDQAGNVYDYSEQNRTLTNNGGVAFGIENLSTYAQFDGVDDYLSRADEVGLEFGASLSVGFWMLPFASGVEQGLVSKWVTAGNLRSWRVVRTATNTIRFDVSGDGIATVSVETTGIVDGNSYHHIVATYITGGTLNIYIDGTLAATNSTGIPASLFDSTAALEIGRSNGASYYSGVIAAPWLAGGALSLTFVKVIYNSTRTLYMF